MTQPHEAVPRLVTIDAGAHQERGQGEGTPEEQGMPTPEGPDGEPGSA